MNASARMDYATFSTTVAPTVYAALLAMGKAVSASGLDRQLTELVELRVSQINQCAFCIQYHLNIARKLSVSAIKLDLLPAWKDVGVFSTRECAALAWAESLTRLETQGAPDNLYATLCAQFTETEVAYLTIAIATINTWNRLAVALRFPPTDLKLHGN